MKSLREESAKFGLLTTVTGATLTDLYENVIAAGQTYDDVHVIHALSILFAKYCQEYGEDGAHRLKEVLPALLEELPKTKDVAAFQDETFLESPHQPCHVPALKGSRSWIEQFLST